MVDEAPRSAWALLRQLREDWQAHGRDWTRPGLHALAVHRFGAWRRRLGPRWLRAPLAVVYRTLFVGVRNLYGIELPDSARVGRRVVLEHQGSIVVHGDAVIGDDCILRQGVTIGNRRLDRPFDAPQLGRGVNVGAGAKVLGGVTVGDGAQIGANAVVLEDVPAHACAAGVPAQLRPPVGTPRAALPRGDSARSDAGAALPEAARPGAALPDAARPEMGAALPDGGAAPH